MVCKNCGMDYEIGVPKESTEFPIVVVCVERMCLGTVMVEQTKELQEKLLRTERPEK